MGRKVFITFLGTGKYKECIYTYSNKESEVVTYVQTATIKLFAPDFDKYFVFCTELASSTHFENLNREVGGKFSKIDIPEGVSEEEIWKIFQLVFDVLEENDEVVFDVTHSFRSIPMLGITLLQYAKFIKNIQVIGIYYGAFEKLGRPGEIEEKYPNPESRKVPLLNLTSFSVLQDWANSGSQFITTGNSTKLLQVTGESIKPILAESRGKDKEAVEIREINSLLEKISEDFSTNRGKNFLKASSILKVVHKITHLEGSLLPAFKPILEKLKRELDNYRVNDKNNLLQAVQWCIDKELVQQGITQLQEATITILCKKLNHEYFNKEKRNIISSYLGFGINQPEEKWKELLTSKDAKRVISELKGIDNIEDIAKAFQALSEKRNDINHGGYLCKSVESKKFKQALEENYQKLKGLL